MATQGANNRRGRNITEVNNVDSRNEGAPSLGHSTVAFSGTQQRDQSIERCNVKARALGELPSEMLERNRLCSVLLSALLPQTMLLVDRGCDADRIRSFPASQKDGRAFRRSEIAKMARVCISRNSAAR
jgi:hypothetical protein